MENVNKLNELLPLCKSEVNEELNKAFDIINDQSRSNSEVWPIISKILDILPFVIQFFPDLKEQILSVLFPLQKEINDLVESLQK